MILNRLIENLPIECLNDVDMNGEVLDVYIGDLLSFVMAHGKEGALWVTVQRHLNVIAVAELNDFVGIVFVEGVEPEADTLAKANELQIPLLKTKLSAFELSQQFIQEGI